MRTTTVSHESTADNPLDRIEEVISIKDWVFDRRSDEEMAVEAPGTWCDFGLFFAWSQELDALHFSCALDMRVQPKILSNIYELIAKLNERLWTGHFAIWVDEGIPMFRHTIHCSGGRLDAAHVDDLVDLARSECERYYPAFQFVIWGGRTPDDAIACALLDTVGEA
ncbi:MAG: hypothetical protein HN793_11815 [Rhodospirillaceae bacterium]|jgi:hypothetical protein|nr:hypothetical protein [Rhodospirillaceae bacterium]MBT5241141.1 hypothetical protein [Rhodospirillaceae bacterium]MBT5565653.1 hypothetical protein [Rhodospirillaceae bacterium]MBT6090859.1 hypothetical protein [Rhodospirillaceae bacterium]MBT6959969.1 hypothetical protein [Rhodospirillaceae bacterium]